MRPVGPLKLGPEHNYVHEPFLKHSHYPQPNNPRIGNPWPPTPVSKNFQNLGQGPGVMPLDLISHRGLPASLQTLSLSSQSLSGASLKSAKPSSHPCSYLSGSKLYPQGPPSFPMSGLQPRHLGRSLSLCQPPPLCLCHCHYAQWGLWAAPPLRIGM